MAKYEFNYEQLCALAKSFEELSRWHEIDYAGKRLTDDVVYLEVDIDEDTCVISTKHHTRSHRYVDAIGVRQ